MSFNTFGKLFKFTTWGESHGPAIGCVIDGCPPNIPLTERDIQADMDRRRPGQSKFTTQRKERDKAIILSGVFEGKTTGTPISIIIYNEDKKSRDYESIKNKFRPGHADYTYFKKYGIRDFRGGGRQSARETASRVAAGAVARVVLKKIIGKKFNVIGAVTQLLLHKKILIFLLLEDIFPKVLQTSYQDRKKDFFLFQSFSSYFYYKTLILIGLQLQLY